jgi:hypothetical protein
MSRRSMSRHTPSSLTYSLTPFHTAGNGTHSFSWRDVYDIAVRWRQVADPYDPVFYMDGLSAKTFEEGIVLGTHMLFEEMRVNKYYSQV